MYVYVTKCLTKTYLTNNCTCLRRCTKRPRVETKATENPVRPCFLCCFWLCAEAGSVSGLRVSKSASTWPNMACSRPRLEWSPLREATEEPFSSELWETHFLVVLLVRLLPEYHIQRNTKKDYTHFFCLLQYLEAHMMKFSHIITHYEEWMPF